MTTLTLSDLKAMQEAAGAAYVEAAAAYRAAFAELHAIDLTIGNANVSSEPQPSFNSVPTILRHPKFLPDTGRFNGALVAADAYERHQQLLRQHKPEAV